MIFDPIIKIPAIKKTCVYVLYHKYDWWFLKRKAMIAGYGSLWSEAYRLCNSKQFFFIGEDAIIESRPNLPHGVNGLFISGGAKIGKNVTILQQVTIGSNTIEGSKGYGFPQIGNNVYIGAGAKIIGNVRVGNDCKIGANAVVVKDIPDGATVVIDSIRVIEK